MASKSRGVDALSRGLRPRSRTPAIYATRSSKRCMAIAADSNSLTQHDNFPASIATPSQHISTMDKPGTTNELESGPNEIRPPRAVQLAYLRPLKRTAKYRIPTCNLQLRSYSVRNLEFFTSFALRAAYFLNLPAVGPVPLPKQIERWTVPKGHFVHKKSQENFERITSRRLIQIQDGHPETVQMWLAYLRKRQYYAVGMKANVWQFEKLGLGREMDVAAEKGESFEDRWMSQISTQMTPEVQAEVDGWMEGHETGSGEDISLAMPGIKSPEKNRTSVQKRIEEILTQIEQQAADTAENSSELSNPAQAGNKILAEEGSVYSGQEPDVAPISQSQTSNIESDSLPESLTGQETVAGTEKEPSSVTAPQKTAIDANSTPPQLQQGIEAAEELSDPIAPRVSDSPPATTESQSAATSSAETISSMDSVEADLLPATAVTKKSAVKKATKSTIKRSTKTASKSASKNEETKAPQPSDVDTSKDISTPEEANPSVEPQTEKAKEAEREDAQEPLGDLPKTPS